jgi:hypothetical protein
VIKEGKEQEKELSQFKKEKFSSTELNIGLKVSQ